MRKMACLVGLVAASALVSTACVEKIDTGPPGSGNAGAIGGNGGSGGDGGTPDTGQEELYDSGSRLQAVVEDGGEGAERLVHFYDNELDQSCSFAEDTDEAVRCLPAFVLPAVQYDDANCTNPVAVVSQCGPAIPQHVSAHVENECPDGAIRRAAYTVQGDSTATATYLMDNGNCVAGPALDLATQSVHELAEADTTLFAEATITTPEVDSGLAQRVATTDDGAFQVLGAYNVARRENCGARTIGEDTLCLSGHLGIARDHSSSNTCDVNDIAITATLDVCGEPQAVVVGTPGADVCEPYTETLNAVGAEYTATVYTDATGTCMANTSSTVRYFEIGGEAMPGVVPALDEATLGEGRLTLQALQTPDGAPVGYATSIYTDATRGGACTARSTADGSKCMPTDLLTVADTGSGYFSDDQCTVELYAHTPITCQTDPPTMFGRLSADVCGADIASLHTVGAAHTATVYIDNGACVASPAIPAIDFYEIGADVALSEFADLTQVTQDAK